MSRTPSSLLLATSLLLLAGQPTAALANTPTLITCNGVLDTEEIQAAVADPDVSYIQLSPGTCTIQGTIKITNQKGLRLQGAGRERTVLKWEGGDGETMFSVQNSAESVFGYFSACAAEGTLESVFDVYNACVNGHLGSCDQYVFGSPGSHRNTFLDLGLGVCWDSESRLENGVRIRLHPDYADRQDDDCAATEEADCGNDQHFFSSVHVRGYERSAFVIEGKYSTGNMFTGSHCSGRPGGFGSEQEYETTTVGEASPLSETIWASSFNPVASGLVIEDTSYSNTDHFDAGVVATYGNSCITTGQVGESDSAGTFAWFGGLADSLTDAVFVMGSSPEAVYVSGLHASDCGMLLRNKKGDASQTGSVTVESSYFRVSESFGQYYENLMHGPSAGSSGLVSPTIANGVIVDMGSSGPLILRSNYFGRIRTGMKGEEAPSNLPDISFCWSPPQQRVPPYDLVTDVGQFVFEGNAVVTRNENPFTPTGSIWTGESVDLECRYPTKQESNIVLVETPEGNTQWKHMPQHKTMLDTDEAFHSAGGQGSHHLFTLVGSGGNLTFLANGVPGQEAVIVGSVFGQGVEDGVDAVHWSPGYRKNIWLPRNQAAVSMRPGAVLMLIKGPGRYWYTVGYSANY